jgi:ABC-type branched-subunit amino acid transport system substrate-binding protein
MFKKAFLISLLIIFLVSGAKAADVKIGLNYPETGPYSIQGLAQLRAAKMAVEEINASGGILGSRIKLITMDSKSKSYVAQRNVEKLIDEHGVEMVFGGSASSVAISGGKAAKSRGKLYFGTLTYSNATTGKEGHRYLFRECYNAWMGAKVLSKYLNENHSGKKFFYITADYTWGWTTEKSIRMFSNTLDKKTHKRAYVPFPNAPDNYFSDALTRAKKSRADVLVLVLFGKDMAKALKMATNVGLKESMAVVVPNLTLGMAESAGPDVMEGVVGALPWTWKVPFQYNYEKGKKFVQNYARRYDTYPSTSAASAYTILYEYKNAVERARTFNTEAVITALENHKYTFLKDEQLWRRFDHQSVQTVYAVKCKSQQQVLRDKYKQDYFEIIDKLDGSQAARTKNEWIAVRKASGKSIVLD